MAELFGVCERTIERDIARLSLEAPIWTEQGRGGGIRVSDGWYVDKRYMSKEQEKYIRELMPTLDDYGQKVMRDILTAFEMLLMLAVEVKVCHNRSKKFLLARKGGLLWIHKY